MNEIKFCKDCKHYRSAQAYMASIPETCHHPENMEIDLVSGRQVFKVNYTTRDPRYHRKQGGCGMEAKRFEQAPEPIQPPPYLEYSPPPKETKNGSLLEVVFGLFR